MVDKARDSGELPVTEALHTYMTPTEQCFNKGIGLEIPTCWMAGPQEAENQTIATFFDFW